VDFRGLAVHPHFHHVEAVIDLRMVQQTQPGERPTGDELLLGEIDGFERRAEVLAAARFHLHKDQRVAAPIAADEIDFTTARCAEVAIEDLEVVRAQVAFGEPFAATPEPMAPVLRPAPGEPPPQVRKTVDESRKDHAHGA